MVLDWFAFGVQQIIEANKKCVTFIIADKYLLFTVHCSLFTVYYSLLLFTIF